MEKRNTVLLTVIAIATLLVAVVGATFAYFTASEIEMGKSVVTVETSSVDQTTAEGTNVSLNIGMLNMNQLDGKNDYTAYKDSDDPGTIKISTQLGSSGGKTTCTYDLVYTPTTGGDYKKSVANTGNLKELTIITEATATGTGSSVQGSSSKETDLTGKPTVTTLVTGAKLIVQGGAGTKGDANWVITPRYYNLGVDQTDNAQKSFGGTVSVVNLSCVNEGV